MTQRKHRYHAQYAVFSSALCATVMPSPNQARQTVLLPGGKPGSLLVNRPEESNSMEIWQTRKPNPAPRDNYTAFKALV